MGRSNRIKGLQRRFPSAVALESSEIAHYFAIVWALGIGQLGEAKVVVVKNILVLVGVRKHDCWPLGNGFARFGCSGGVGQPWGYPPGALPGSSGLCHTLKDYS